MTNPPAGLDEAPDDAHAAAPPPDATAPPTVPLRYRVGAVSVTMGVNLALYTMHTNLIPRQVEAVVGEDRKADVLGLVVGVGAVTAVVANLLAGALSDRTRWRWGRRRTWVLGGLVLGGPVIALFAVQHTVLGMVLAWAAAQAAVNAAGAAVTASVPDQVPVAARGAIAGLIGAGLPLGLVVGIAMVSTVVHGLAAGVVAVAIAYMVLLAPFALVRDEPSAVREPVDWRAFLAAFWIDPRRHPDFGWAWLTRAIVVLANAIGLTYLLYYLQDVLHLRNATQGQALLEGLAMVGAVAASVVAGRMSDRSGRRKVYVIWSTLLLTVAGLLMALLPTWPTALVSAAMLGLGYGTYLAVDLALITQVLPAAAEAGKDLGVMNIANAAPQALAPAIAAPLVSSGLGYRGVYVIAAAVAVIGAVLVPRIRSVR